MKLKWQFVPLLAALLVLGLVAFSISRSYPVSSAEAAAPPSRDAQIPFRHSASDSDTETKLPTVTPPELTIPAGTALEIRMQTALSSASASLGEHFDALLEEPLVINDQFVAPRGAEVTGWVVAVRRSGRLHNPGYLRITLISLNLHGQAMPVHTSSVFVQAGSHKKRNWALIGGGSGAGALIGALTGGGKGALIGGAIGAGAGTGAALATGKKDVGIAAERRLTFRLTEALVTHG